MCPSPFKKATVLKPYVWMVACVYFRTVVTLSVNIKHLKTITTASFEQVAFIKKGAPLGVNTSVVTSIYHSVLQPRHLVFKPWARILIPMSGEFLRTASGHFANTSCWVVIVNSPCQGLIFSKKMKVKVVPGKEIKLCQTAVLPLHCQLVVS